MKALKFLFGSEKLTLRVLVAMLTGTLIGVALNQVSTDSFLYTTTVDGIFTVLGNIFISSLKMLVVPLVFISLVTGVASMSDVAKLGRIGMKTMGLYLMTTLAAIILGLGAGVLFNPGAGFVLKREAANYTAKEAPSFVDTLSAIVPANPIQSAANGDMLQIIVFAILFGIGIVLCGAKAAKVSELFSQLNEVMLKIVKVLMGFAPLGVFVILAKVFAQEGFEVFIPLLRYVFLVIGVLLFQMFITYPALVKVFTRLSPIVFVRRVREVVMIAISTSSSNATIPVTMRTVTEKLGVDRGLASFTVPLGATINMDGTAITQGVATVFIAQVYGIELTLTSYITVIVASTLASIGTAGVPGMALMTLALVLKQAGLPVEGIALILGVDRIVDMVVTATNVMGDTAVTTVVAKSEKQLDKRVFEAHS